MSDLTIVLTCRRCGSDVVPVNLGRPYAGSEVSAIVRCSECPAEWHVTALLRPVTDRREDFPLLAPEPVCGTEAGRQAHYRRGEPACGECKAAHAVHERSRRPRPLVERQRGPGPEEWINLRIRKRRELIALMGEG